MHTKTKYRNTIFFFQYRAALYSDVFSCILGTEVFIFLMLSILPVTGVATVHLNNW